MFIETLCLHFADGVKLDVCIDSVNAHSEICKALVISRFRNCTFKLYLNKVDATFLGEVKLKVLLDLVDPAVSILRV